MMTMHSRRKGQKNMIVMDYGRLSNPLPRLFQDLNQPAFLTCFAVAPKIAHVLPSRCLRQAHQDTLNPCSRCIEPKLSSAVVYEVELDISSASEQLPASLVVIPRH